jgi:hypothetical protein
LMQDCAWIIFFLSPSLVPQLIAAGVDRSVRGKPSASDLAPEWIKLNHIGIDYTGPVWSRRRLRFLLKDT